MSSEDEDSKNTTEDNSDAEPTKAPPKRSKPNSAQKKQEALNARGMPARLRKKNQFFEGDQKKAKNKAESSSEELTEPEETPTKKMPLRTTPRSIKHKISATKASASKKIKQEKEDSSDHEEDDIEDEPKDDDSDFEAEIIKPSAKKVVKPKKLSKASLSKSLNATQASEAEKLPPIDKKACQRVGLRLRNLLKLPKAHKFVMYEFFYSTIDQPLLFGGSDFEMCLRQTFPNLKSRMMTRTEWNKVRSVLGKPRRMSNKFFAEERRTLERKRQKIRLLQSRKSGDLSFVCDLPNSIPLPLAVGTKVTARLRYPQDGLFTGVIDALEPTKSAYRITFDRNGIGFQTIPDYEVCCYDPVQETIQVSSLTKAFKAKENVSYYMVAPLKKAGPSSSMARYSMLNQAKVDKLKLALPADGLIKGNSVELLNSIVRAKRTLEAKHMQLLKIRRMNTDAELAKAFGDMVPDDFQKRYASLVLGLEKMNKELQDNLNLLQANSQKHIDEPECISFFTPSYLREKCREMAIQTFRKNNQNQIKDDAMAKLISNLSTIMWVTSNLKNDAFPNVSSVLDGVLEEAKAHLDPENVLLFQKNVQSHVLHIQIGILDDDKQKEEPNYEEIVVEECLGN